MADATISGDTDKNDGKYLIRQWISAPLSAQTLWDQNLFAQIRASETASGNNLYVYLNILLVSNDGSTLRGTVASTADSLEAATSLTNRGISLITSKLSAQLGDRIVIEIGLSGDPHASGNGHNGAIRVGDVAGSDLPEDDTTTSDYNPWVEFYYNLLWATADITIPVDLGTLSLTGYSVAVDGGAAPATVEVACGSLALAGNSVTVVGEAATIPLQAGSLSISGLPVTVIGEDATIPLQAGSLTISGYSVTVSTGLVPPTIPLEIGTLTLSGYSVTVLGEDAAIPIDLGALTLSGFPVTVRTEGAVIELETGILTLNGLDVVLVAQGGIVDVSVGQLNISGYPVTVVGEDPLVVIPLSLGSLSLTGYGVTVVGSAYICQVSLGLLTLSGLTVDVYRRMSTTVTVGTSEFGSLDVSVTLPDFETDQWVAVQANIKDEDQSSDTGMMVRIYNDQLELVSTPSNVVLDTVELTAVTGSTSTLFSSDFMPLFSADPEYEPESRPSFSRAEVIRASFQNNSVIIFRNNSYFHSFIVPKIQYSDEECQVIALCSAGWTAFPTVQITVTELDDWREAIYIETEALAMSGISSLIQERPVSIVSRQDGSLDFFYNLTAEEYDIASDIIRRHVVSESDAMSASDALIEGRDVAALCYPEYADEIGYTFRILRLGSLDSGEKRVARVLLQRGMENLERHSLALRPDLRIEPGDAIAINPTITATGTRLDYSIAVESVDVTISYNSAEMAIEGRKNR